MCEVNKYEYNQNYTFEELSSLVEDFIKEMGTYDYWLEYGADFPEENKGFDLFQLYIATIEHVGLEDKKRLIPKFSKMNRLNLSRPKVINISSTPTVPVFFNHRAYELPVKNLKTIAQLRKRLKRLLNSKSVYCTRDIWIQSECGFLLDTGRVLIDDGTIMFAGNCN